MHGPRPLDYLLLKNLRTNTEIGKLGFKFYAPQKWDSLKKKSDGQIPFTQF